MRVTGYLHPYYAESLAEFGTPRKLPHSGGWVLERSIPGTADRDAMGCYPLFTCSDWPALKLDLDSVCDGLVSLALVIDPFGPQDMAALRDCFDVMRPFKEHYVVDLSRPLDTFVSSDRRRCAKRAAREVSVELLTEPADHLDDWLDLYSVLVRRHQIQGIKAFSREAFVKQLAIPGLTMIAARHEGKLVGADLWYVQGNVAYGHLTATSELGYRLRASCALYQYALDYFGERREVEWLDLGAGAGLNGDGEDGLSQFKRGWASGTRIAYFCGRIFDPLRYSQLAAAYGVGETAYFPAYRHGEFS